MKPTPPSGYGSRQSIQENVRAWHQHFLLETRRKQARIQALREARTRQKLERIDTETGLTRQEKEQREIQRQQRESRRFYERVGYPQYARKYQPFTVPEGHVIETLKETKAGLQVSFKPIPKRKGVAESMLEWKGA